MKYDFDKIYDRKHFNSAKWNELKEKFGSEDLVPLWVADMDFQSPKPVIDALVKAAEHGIYGYTSTPDSYYNSIIGWMKKRHNWDIRKDWINIAPGVISALSFIIRIFSQPGDKIVIQPPVYYPFSASILKNGRQVSENPLILKNNRYYMDFSDLEEKLEDPRTKLFILCSPHNPIGRVWSKEELIELGNLCLKHNVKIVSDEIHSDIVYPDYKHIPFASISSQFEQNCIVCTAPSKTFNLAGLKTSTIIIPNKELFRNYDNFIDSLKLKRNNYFGLFALESAYLYGEEWLDQLLNYLSKNLYFLKDYIAENIPEIKIIEPEGTYLVWLDFRSLNLNATSLSNLLVNKAKVALDDGYWFGKEGREFERINIACPRKILENGLDKISAAIKNMKESI